ncbi:hypothetical protein ACFL43_00060 [Thermodesulfobacteriota bacterium]
MRDTHPSAEKVYREKMMQRSSEERFVMGARMFESARRLVLASLPPGMSRAERSFQLFLRLYGNEIDQDTQARVRQRLLCLDSAAPVDTE